MMVFLKFFLKKLILKKKSKDDKKNMQNYPACKELKEHRLVNEIKFCTTSHKTCHYSPFDIFQKVLFYLALYIEEVNLQTFSMIYCKTICHNYLCTKDFILMVLKQSNIFTFSHSKNGCTICISTE